MKTLFLTVVVFGLSQMCAVNATAQVATPYFVIRSAYADHAREWPAPFLVRPATGQPILNPDHCMFTDGYGDDADFPTGTPIHDLLVNAFLWRKPVRLVIQGCSNSNRPRIISIAVKN